MARTWPRSGIEPPDPLKFVRRAAWDGHEVKFMDDFPIREMT